MTTKRVLSILLACFFIAIGAATSVGPSEAEIQQRRLMAEVKSLEDRRDALLKRIEKLEKQCMILESKTDQPEEICDE